MPINLTVTQPAPVRLSYVEAAIKPEVTGHVTPTYEQQTVYPAAGTVFGSVEVDAIPDPTDIKEIGSNGDHDVRRYGTARVSVTPTLQSKTATPTEQAQTILPDTGYDGLESVEIGRIPTEYIIPTGKKNITQNGVESVREYDSVDVSVQPTLQDKTVTPTKQTQTVNADSGFDGLGTVQVDPIPSEYIVPTGKVTITQDGTVDVSQFSEAEVNTAPNKGIILSDYDSDGYPTKCEIKGWTEIPNYFFYSSGNRFASHMDTLTLEEGLTTVGSYQFNSTRLTTLYLPDSVVSLGTNMCQSSAVRTISIGCNQFATVGTGIADNVTTFIFRNNIAVFPFQSNNYSITTNATTLIDMSHNTEVATLQSATNFRKANGCVIRVPQSLLSEWQEATNWNALTGVVWEGV